MTTIHLIGGEGFIGKAIQREASEISLHSWSHRLKSPEHYFDLLDSSSWQTLISKKPTHVIFLSWPGLPNYQEHFHVSRNLPACIELIERLVATGLQRLVVAGTCYEYGIQNGALKEDKYLDPQNCYSIAKDSLRRVIAHRFSNQDLEWCWVRIFYPYGQGQNPNSLIPSLRRAIDHKHTEFAMSSGRQIRDFIKVKKVAQILLELTINKHAHGIYNCGSGIPISLRELAEKCIAESNSSTILKLGTYPDRKDEPLAFWADMEKTQKLLDSN